MATDVLFDHRISDREFGGTVLSVAHLIKWSALSGVDVQTIPPLSEFKYVQAEAFLCAIERWVTDSFSSEDAIEILMKRPDLCECKVVKMAREEYREHGYVDRSVLWLLAADASQQWRERLRKAVAAGELHLLDPASLLPTAPATTEPIKSCIGSSEIGFEAKNSGIAIKDLTRIFKINEASWGDKLRRQNKYSHARVATGGKGRSNAHRYNPAQFAATYLKEVPKDQVRVQMLFAQNAELAQWRDEFDGLIAENWDF